MSGIFSYFLGGGSPASSGKLEPIKIHSIENSDDKRAKSASYLIKANHVNHSILYNHGKFHNHASHLISSAYILGANEEQLRTIYEAEGKELEPWVPAPAEVIDEDWRDFLGNYEYQRGFIDFFEDKLVEAAYDWKKVVSEWLFLGKEPLFNALMSGLGHPLIHLAYAFEMDSKDIAMEALAMACCCYNYMHKYSDDAKYTRPSSIPSASPSELLKGISNDPRFDAVPKDLATSASLADLLTDFEDPIMDYWNAWNFDDPVKALEHAQEAAVEVVIGSANPSTKSGPYNFYYAHILTSSHAMRVLLPLIPADRQISMLRQWWLFTIAVYLFRNRPAIDSNNINKTLDGRDWAYVEDKAINSDRLTEAHYIKVVRTLKEAEKTWGSKDNFYLLAACTFVDNYQFWTYS